MLLFLVFFSYIISRLACSLRVFGMSFHTIDLGQFTGLLATYSDRLLYPHFGAEVVCTFKVLFIMFTKVSSAEELCFITFTFMYFLVLRGMFFQTFFGSRFRRFPSDGCMAILV